MVMLAPPLHILNATCWYGSERQWQYQNLQSSLSHSLSLRWKCVEETSRAPHEASRLQRHLHYCPSLLLLASYSQFTPETSAATVFPFICFFLFLLYCIVANVRWKSKTDFLLVRQWSLFRFWNANFSVDLFQRRGEGPCGGRLSHSSRYRLSWVQADFSLGKR